jgi:hypothetical protein
MELKRPFTEEDWEATPKPVRQYIIQLEDIVYGGPQSLNRYNAKISSNSFV